MTHTNDLTALALVNSTLYSLAVPYIYGRFDIVWPDTSIQNNDSKGVDALTYGLATLCHGSNFARRVAKAIRPYGVNDPGKETFRLPLTNYAQYTRKFSLGNGPEGWVSEYMINKESGKMLGTLVAIAVEKMINLETFIWDMPTGVLSDVFISLSSLADRPGHESKLERIWVRWHDHMADLHTTTAPQPVTAVPPTAQQAIMPPGSSMTPVGVSLATSASHPPPQRPYTYIESPVEYPTFSILPPLKSLTVLDIDEISYVDEMAILIERSRYRLQELRVGIAAKAYGKDFVQTWDGPDLKQTDLDARWPGESKIGQRRLGGILGALVGRIHEIRRKTNAKGKAKDHNTTVTASTLQDHQESEDTSPNEGSTNASFSVSEQQQDTPPSDSQPTMEMAETTASVGEATSGFETVESLNEMHEENIASKTAKKQPFAPISIMETSDKQEADDGAVKTRLDEKMKLMTLELERVPLSLAVCSKVFDWTVLTSFTLLDCEQHEGLWKLLRKQFQPTPLASTLGMSSSRPAQLQYHLSLKRIHTDHTSPALLSFLKETLAPNSLEVLFLQDRRRQVPTLVEIDQIYKGPVKRHRASLHKLLIDSSARTRGAIPGDSSRWRHWVPKTEFVNFITSGRMPNLRELSISLEYKDWVGILLTLVSII